MLGSARSEWTILGLPQPKVAHTPQVHTTQVLGCSARAPSQVSSVFCAPPTSKPLSFSGASQNHRPRWAVHFVSFPGPTAQATGCLVSSLSQVGRASYSPAQSQPPVSWVCHESTVPGMLCVSSGELISGCDTPGRCQPSRIPGRCG